MNRDAEQIQFQIGMLQPSGRASLQAIILQTIGTGECLRVAIAPVTNDEAAPLAAPNRVVLEIENIKTKLKIQIEQANLPGCVLNENGQLFWVREYSAPPTRRNLNRIHRALLGCGFSDPDRASLILDDLGTSEGEQNK